MDPRPPLHTGNLLVFAPNWLGDAVMALPAIADVRRAGPTRSSPSRPGRRSRRCFDLVDGVDERDRHRAEHWRARAHATPPRRFDAALLLPNSFHAAILAWRARHRASAGATATDWRGAAADARDRRRRRGCIRSTFYQHLVAALGFSERRRSSPRIERRRPHRAQAGGDAARGSADGMAGRRWSRSRQARRTAARSAGRRRRLRRWPRSWRPTASTAVMVGAGADRGRSRRRASLASAAAAPGADVCQSHRPHRSADARGRAGAVPRAGDRTTRARCTWRPRSASPVTAMFGPTDERATRPIGDAPRAVADRTTAWCRPCMLRECPLDHRCMRGIGVDAACSPPRRQIARERLAFEAVGGLSRPRRHAHRRGRLPRSRRARRALSVDASTRFAR